MAPKETDGASNDTSAVCVPAAEETVTISWASPKMLVVAHVTEVPVLHASVAHADLEASADAVVLAGPKFKP
jgi:hypothetical protein